MVHWHSGATATPGAVHLLCWPFLKRETLHRWNSHSHTHTHPHTHASTRNVPITNFHCVRCKSFCSGPLCMLLLLFYPPSCSPSLRLFFSSLSHLLALLRLLFSGTRELMHSPPRPLYAQIFIHKQLSSPPFLLSCICPPIHTPTCYLMTSLYLHTHEN